MTPRYTDLQLDALRELANIGSGTAATALSQLLGREVEISVPRVLALPLAEAVEAWGAPDAAVSGIVIPLEGDITGVVVLLIPSGHAHTLCRLLGVEPSTEVGDSALCEIGNILGTSYLNALVMTTGLSLTPAPPSLSCGTLKAIVASQLVQTSGATGLALVLDSELDVAGDPCSMAFLLLPTEGGVSKLLAPLGLADPASGS